MKNDEKKYEDVIKALKGLKEVKAPDNFEADLKRRINSEKFSKEERKGFWGNIFVPARLIPSLGLIAAAVVIFYVVETNSEEIDNPFLIEPRVRTDLIAVTDYKQLKEEHQNELKKSELLEKEKNVPEPKPNQSELKSSRDERASGREKDEITDKLTSEQDFAKAKGVTEGTVSAPESTFTAIVDSVQPTVPSEESSDLVAGQRITKEELNFRQVQLSEKEQKVVNELKNQVQNSERPAKYQK
ncbi:MAG: hypothetical protein OQJ93_03650 [Ignavibacteriaceae bacterium]|nr:hypothetical protein [Ignavibacteriaceae bacterium]MCW8814006.1 hypothetical protein [Chlorobium sp.]MCW8823697.1 hypothetical protein [Ignavibacteriaceae bacterium]MCW8961387.1 hypothetical protein [Ignavibacteriaceae bacterium]MCW9096461.1 hypothetical protein [Ignavibacteriaceae bacterium]